MYKTLLILSLVFFYYAIEAKTVKLDIDWAMFRYDENQVLCEMYYSFPDTLIKYNLKSDAGLYEGEIYFNITIKSSVNTVAEKEWIVTNSSALPVTEHKTDLVGQRNFLLSPGQYEVLIQLIDVNDGSTKADLTINLIVKKFNNNKIDISDIELAKYIEYKTETTVKWNESFKKGNLYVVPNPTHMCFGDNLNIKAYYEIYNSKHISPDGFIIKYRILDAAKREELMIKNDKVADRDVMLEIATLPVDILPTGVYYFETTILFPKDNPTDSVSESEQFYVLNPEIPPNLITNFTENVTFDKSEWVVMSDEQINTEFEKAKFIATPNEIELWKEISTVEAKQKFMYAFWNIRNQDTTKPYNEKLLEYRKLIDYANTFYSFGKSDEGWRTDRGRTLLKYGKPTHIDQTAVRGDYKAYEAWTYNDVQGGVIFHFVDMIGIGNFVLVNSTAFGEIRNENWYNQYVIPKNLQNSDENYPGINR